MQFFLIAKGKEKETNQGFVSEAQSKFSNDYEATPSQNNGYSNNAPKQSVNQERSHSSNSNIPANAPQTN